MNSLNDQYYQCDENSLLTSLGTAHTGLSDQEAIKRLKEFGYNKLGVTKNSTTLHLLVSQIKSPLTIILIASAILSFFLGERVDAVIILFIIIISALLGFF
jgi:magnesium-transporting ATPase (P-type)